MKDLLILFIILLFFSSCREEFVDPPVDSGISNVVVEGTITNQLPPYTIKLTRSLAYNISSDSAELVGISNALVTVSDDLGNQEEAVESSENLGNYIIKGSKIKGVIGRSYMLKIDLRDDNGNITETYESDWDVLNGLPSVDSLYVELGSTDSFIKERNGSYTIYSTDGLNMYVDANVTSDQDYYLKFTSSMLQETSRDWVPMGMGTIGSSAIGIYSWYTVSLSIEKDLRSFTKENAVPLKHIFVGFIPEFFSDESDNFHSAFVANGSVITFTIYSVSKTVYKIFSEEYIQLNPSNSIFDPMPTQIGTNIKCTSDPSISPLGYFSAQSILQIYHFFNWTRTTHFIYSYVIDSLSPDIPSSGVDTSYALPPEPPYFWFNNYGKVQ